MESVLLALFGTSVFSAGVIMQKKGSVWMSWKTGFNYDLVSKVTVWLIGMILSYVVSAALMGIASKRLTPEMISAITGWNIVMIVLLSSAFLKEKLYKTDIVCSLVIILCIFIMSRYQSSSMSLSSNIKYLYGFLVIPFILLVPVFIRQTDRKVKTILLSVFSGLLGGLTIVFMNLLVKESGGSIGGILSSPLLFVYFITGIVSVTAKQAAYRLGDVILITPVQTSFSMVYPLVCSYVIFDSRITAVQLCMVVLIVLSCWKIQKKR
jgi:drug/metabolite transporter (DMT)-like permease